MAACVRLTALSAITGRAMKHIPLLGFLLVVGVLVALMMYYHNNTESPFDSEVFFGPKETPAEPAAPQNNRP